MIKAIGILLPIILAVVAWLKKVFNLDGWKVRGAALLVASGMATGYGIWAGLEWYQIVALSLGSWVASGGSFDWLKEFVRWLGEGLT